MNDYATDEIEALLGPLEDDEADDGLAERRGRSRNFPRLPTTPSGNLSSPRPQGQAVTQMQLQALATRVDGRLKQLDTKTGVLERRVNTVNHEQGRQAAAIKKEITARMKEAKEQRQIIQLLAILPLISRPSSRTLTADIQDADTARTVDLKKGDKVLIDSDGLSALLPLLLIGGIGGG